MKNQILVALIILGAPFTNPIFALPKLSSLPSAQATIFLDFDGHTVQSAVWNNGNRLVCAAPALTDAQITEIFNRVSEDYRPFDVNITTDSTKFLSAPLTKRIRVIITPTSSWKPNVGGISFIGSFVWGDDTPAFVFSDRLGPNNAKFVAECCSHESGHSLGLSHQSKYDNNCNLTETYNTGIGSGSTAWAPIMGNSYNRNMTGWHDGATPYGCYNTQDNLSIITSVNGFGYRTDDYSDSLNNNAFQTGNSSFSINGIVSTTNDRDVFKITLPTQSNIHIDAIPFNLGNGSNGSNLDIKIMLYDERKTLIRIYDAINEMGITIDSLLKAGSYYVVLDGAGNSNTLGYGSIGSYSLTGFRAALPIREVTLSGNVNKQTHKLNWNIVSDEPIKEITVEISIDGIEFKSVNTATVTSRGFSLNCLDNYDHYYRLKVISVIEQVVYSNVIRLKSEGDAPKPYQLNTMVYDRIQIATTEKFVYKIMDINGRVYATGKINTGTNQINMNNFISGAYVLQLLGQNKSYAERIIKQ